MAGGGKRVGEPYAMNRATARFGVGYIDAMETMAPSLSWSTRDGDLTTSDKDEEQTVSLYTTLLRRPLL